MKRENFERVQQIMKDLATCEDKISEIKSVCQYTPVQVSIGKYRDVYIPERFDHLFQAYIHQVLEELRAEIKKLEDELETL